MSTPHGSADHPSAKTPDAVAPSDDLTSLPGLRSWRAVYGFVLAILTVWIVGLLALEAAFT